MEEGDKGKDLNNSEDTEMRLGGNITLSGFSLEPAEMIVVKKIVGHYAKKISEKIDYQEIKITLKKTRKMKNFLHEISASIKTNKGILAADTVNNNLYTSLSDALDKAYNQAERKERTARQ
jgi:ribosome-associated translation inhibitor RaiA